MSEMKVCFLAPKLVISTYLYYFCVNLTQNNEMASWSKEVLPRENGQLVSMQIPEIISASRSTDIPAFYADWFFHRMKVGYSAWKNPFNGVKGYVSYKNARFIIFWSKNPRPLLQHLDYLGERGINCYIQYSLNDYEKEALEPGVPPLEERIETFKELVRKLGKGHVIWRFDPLVQTDTITKDTLLERIENIGDRIHDYTEKLVFSFADISIYKKVSANLQKEHIAYNEWTVPQMREFASRLSDLNSRWGLDLATCAENPELRLSDFGIKANRCVDDRLMVRFGYRDSVLMNALKVQIHPLPQPDIFGNTETLPQDAIILPDGMYATMGDNTDKGQRLFCGCMRSKDIGEYNTCIHQCKYCYANATRLKAVENYAKHKANPYAETITGE